MVGGGFREVVGGGFREDVGAGLRARVRVGARVLGAGRGGDPVRA